MGEFKGTPGPWSLVVSDDSDDGMITSEFREGMIEISTITGAHPESGFDIEFQQEQLANAKLIAAAPELLEALQAIVRNAQPFIGAFEFDRDDSSVDGEKMFENAVKAINKAIGE